jgi:hypothetical protein
MTVEEINEKKAQGHWKANPLAVKVSTELYNNKKASNELVLFLSDGFM